MHPKANFTRFERGRLRTMSSNAGGLRCPRPPFLVCSSRLAVHGPANTWKWSTSLSWLSWEVIDPEPRGNQTRPKGAATRTGLALRGARLAMALQM
jgi:hypothetical protein